MMKRDKEPAFYIAVRFARLRDRSIGQKDEIDALLEILKGTEQIIQMSNDAFLSVIGKKRPRSAEYIQQTTFDIVVKVGDGLAKYIDAKISRIKKLLDYFILDQRPVDREIKELKEFETLWDDLQQEYRRIKNEFIIKSTKPTKNALDELKIFQDTISVKGISLMKRLNELEDRIQKDAIHQIASFTKTNTVVDSNALYKLLTDEP